MDKKRLGVFAGILFLMILLSGVISADTCSVVTRENCWETGKYIVMKLSSRTNAHGEFPDQGGSYDDYVLCCDFGTGDTSCSETNKIIGLSSSTNAHAEIPTEPNYLTDVCYEDLECLSMASCVPDYPIPMLSLSDWTNAHIGPYDEYDDIKICCGPRCNLDSALWSHTTVVEGIEVSLDVVGTSCDGKTVSFSVYEEDSFLEGGDDEEIDIDFSTATFSGTTASTTWTTVFHDDCYGACLPSEHYFTASVVGKDEQITSSNRLSVTETPPLCKLTLAEWSTTSAVETELVFLNVQGTNCDGETISFEVREDDGTGWLVGQNVINNPSDVVFSGNSETGTWIAEWQEDFLGDPEYFFRAIVESSGEYIQSTDPSMTVTKIPPSYCDDKNYCRDYLVQGECESDICEVGEASVNENHPEITCGMGYDCYCAWTVGVCGPGWTTAAPSICPSKPTADEVCSDIEVPIYDTNGDVCRTVTGTKVCTAPCPDGPNPEDVCDGQIVPIYDTNNDICGAVYGIRDCTAICPPGRDPSTICEDIIVPIYDEDDNICKIVIGTKVCTAICPDGPDPSTICKSEFELVYDGEGYICKIVMGTMECGDGIPPSIGSCIYNEDTSSDDCEDGFLSYSWTATWTWDELNIFDYDPNGGSYIEEPAGKWHYDPERISETCVPGEKTVPCPAEIKLPFFGFYNLIATAILIALIYGLMFRKKRKGFE